MSHFFKLAVERNTIRRSVKVGLVVGFILNLINNPGLLLFHPIGDLQPGRIILTFLVPFFVSTYSSVVASHNL